MRNGKGVRLRVLVADDHDDVRRAIVRVLSEAFEIVGEVSTGAAVVEAVRALHPDVIVSDLAMPQLNGLEAMKVLRDTGHTVPFVLMTAGVKDAQAWIDSGVFGVVDKSDAHTDLLPAVRAAAIRRTYLSRSVKRS
jgi:DNA-binding NarL/FixJ family response regulator